jgi:hypothetical protein
VCVCEFWGCCSHVIEDGALLGEQFPTFCRSILRLSRRVKWTAVKISKLLVGLLDP